MRISIAHQRYESDARIIVTEDKDKLIEGRLPHIFIAKDIAQVTDQKIEYSKHKGLDDKKCEALLLDSLKDHGSLTKPEIVRLLWDVLPDQLDDKQKEYKINNLLRKLRKEGKISNTTNLEVHGFFPTVRGSPCGQQVSSPGWSTLIIKHLQSFCRCFFFFSENNGKTHCF